MRQEIKITASITIGVNAEWSKENLVEVFNNASIKIIGNKLSDNWTEYWDANLDIIEIEKEAEIYGNK